MFLRKKARDAHAREALKDMTPQDPLSTLTKGERDLDELLGNATKKIKSSTKSMK